MRQGFYIPFENRLSYRATSIKMRLPENTFWLPDNINMKTYSKTFGCPVGQPGENFLVPDRKKSGQPVMWNPDEGILINKHLK